MSINTKADTGTAKSSPRIKAKNIVEIGTNSVRTNNAIITLIKPIKSPSFIFS
ncbi:MAG: hypothetical protein O8C63_02165 [Candidatus Methanoperedens sp.]|nr:hypothetical protein [Candidatus Methanoperedens sp.]